MNIQGSIEVIENAGHKVSPVDTVPGLYDIDGIGKDLTTNQVIYIAISKSEKDNRDITFRVLKTRQPLINNTNITLNHNYEFLTPVPEVTSFGACVMNSLDQLLPYTMAATME